MKQAWTDTNSTIGGKTTSDSTAKAIKAAPCVSLPLVRVADEGVPLSKPFSPGTRHSEHPLSLPPGLQQSCWGQQLWERAWKII